MNNKYCHLAVIFASSILSLSKIVYSQTGDIPIDYFGLTPPDMTPKIFAPGIICLDNRFEARGAFSPDGKTFYFTITNENYSSQKILFCYHFRDLIELQSDYETVAISLRTIRSYSRLLFFIFISYNLCKIHSLISLCVFLS